MRDLRIIFTVAAFLLSAYGLWLIGEERAVSKARRNSAPRIYEGLQAIKIGVGHCLWGLAFLYPWVPGYKLPVAFFSVSLLAGLGAWFFHIQARLGR